MPRDHRLYLDDILEAIAKIREYTADLDYTAFEKDTKTQDAVVRNLEIIGEAAGHLPAIDFYGNSGNRVAENHRTAQHSCPRVFRSKPAAGLGCYQEQARTSRFYV